MGAIVPRWEFRAFARSFGAAETTLTSSGSEPPVESDELYLLAEGGETVKVRGGLIDIKVLREVDAEGLQRWEPVMKEGFPLPATEVRGGATNLFQAMQLALATLPTGHANRIVLLTDGRQNAGNALAGAQSAKNAGIDVENTRVFDQAGVPQYLVEQGIGPIREVM